MVVKSPVLCSQFLPQFFYLYILTLCLLLYLWCFSMCLCSVKINHSWIPFPTKSCLFFPITVKSSFSIFEFSGYNCFKIGFLFYMCVCIYVCIYMCVCVCVCVCINVYDQYFGHLMHTYDSLDKFLMLGKMEDRGKGGIRGWDGWMTSSMQWTWTWANPRRWWET